MIAATALAGHRSGTAPAMLRKSGIFDERTHQPAFIPPRKCSLCRRLGFSRSQRGAISAPMDSTGHNVTMFFAEAELPCLPVISCAGWVLVLRVTVPISRAAVRPNGSTSTVVSFASPFAAPLAAKRLRLRNAP